MNHTITRALIAVAGCATMYEAHATVLNSGDVLTITAGVPVFDSDGYQVNVANGSWFGANLNGNLVIDGAEKSKLAQGTTGLVIGVTTSIGAHHGGYPAGTDSNDVTAPWDYFGATGSDYIVSPVIGGTINGLDMSGWRIAWNTIDEIILGSGAWGIGFTSGVANFNWNGLYGSAYTLDYRATIPSGPFSGLQYALHLEGMVEAASVPEPTTTALIGLGLLGLSLVRRQRKQV